MTPDILPGTRWVGEAPAKVNLFLRILEREPSGYHRLDTLFQALELSDTVAVERHAAHSAADGEFPAVELEVRGVGAGELGPPDRNLAVRAARRFQDEVGSRGGSPPALRVELVKRIPHGAGLGGGSSDAASVLLGANAVSGSPLTPDDLRRIGGELGSDVPFFLSGVPTALGAGRGNVLTPVSPLPQRDVLLLVPAEGISTGWAYGVLAEARLGAARDRSPTDGTPVQGRAGSAGTGEGFTASWERIVSLATNDFEAVLFPLRPEFGRWKGLLQRHGASPALLSGSGSVLFGIFSDPEALERARREAEVSGLRTVHTRTRA